MIDIELTTIVAYMHTVPKLVTISCSCFDILEKFVYKYW